MARVGSGEAEYSQILFNYRRPWRGIPWTKQATERNPFTNGMKLLRMSAGRAYMKKAGSLGLAPLPGFLLSSRYHHG